MKYRLTCYVFFGHVLFNYIIDDMANVPAETIPNWGLAVITSVVAFIAFSLSDKKGK